MNETEMLMEWDDPIENEDRGFAVLEEGDYCFTVTDFARGRYPGSAKLPACNRAELTLKVETEKGPVTVRTDLILHRSLEWKLCAFFRCIGQKKQGERMAMNWNAVIGSRGRAHFKPRTYTGSDGKEHRVNDVDRYLDYDPSLLREAPEEDWTMEADRAPDIGADPAFEGGLPL